MIMKGNISVLVTVYVLLFLGLANIGLIHAQDNEYTEEIRTPGAVSGIGSYFEIVDSDYLNISLESTSPLNVMVESIPSTIMIEFESASDNISTQITIGGLEPFETYYKYEDFFNNPVVFTADDSGRHTYTQDLSSRHFVFILTSPSTISIEDDSTGGGCSQIGIWRPTTKTCMLTTDITETIQILSHQITLDGNGYSITGSGTGVGVYVPFSRYVTIRNLVVRGFSIGAYFRESSNATVAGSSAIDNHGDGVRFYRSGNSELSNNILSGNAGSGIAATYSRLLASNNTASNNSRNGIDIAGGSSSKIYNNTASKNMIYGIYLNSSGASELISNISMENGSSGIVLSRCYGCESSNNTVSYNERDGITVSVGGNTKIRGNAISSNANIGIYLDYGSNGSTVQDNIVKHNLRDGIRLNQTSGNTIYANDFLLNLGSGIYVYGSNSANNTFTGNSIRENGYGIYSGYYSSDNEFSDNNLINNGTNASNFHQTNVFIQNYWNDYDTASEGCNDDDLDGYCDSPYSIDFFTQDNYPRTTPFGFNTPPSANAGENVSITSEEINSTIIHGVGTDEDSSDLLKCRWLDDEDVLLDWMATGANGDCLLYLNTISLSIGTYTLTLEISDGQEISSDQTILSIDNSAPNAAPTGSGVYQINTDVILGGDISDFDGDTLNYLWLEGDSVLFSGNIHTISEGSPVSLPPHSTSSLGLGTHTISLQVDDGINGPVSRDIVVEIVDTNAPTLAPVPDHSILWPANHKMVNITIDVHAHDNSEVPPIITAVVTSDELSDGLGDGDMSPDWDIVEIDQITGTIYIQLRAERSGNGDGRTYTISITATDLTGNSSTSTLEIIVPHDKK